MPADAARGSHWDLMIEVGDVLWTWAMDELPAAGGSCPATRLPHHRRTYLTYEGPVSGDRGDVARYDGGEYELLQQTSDRFVLRLAGGKVQGVAELQRDSDAPGTDQRWTFRLSNR